MFGQTHTNLLQNGGASQKQLQDQRLLCETQPSRQRISCVGNCSFLGRLVSSSHNRGKKRDGLELECHRLGYEFAPCDDGGCEPTKNLQTHRRRSILLWEQVGGYLGRAPRWGGGADMTVNSPYGNGITESV